jgi:uncharacterized protein HemY
LSVLLLPATVLAAPGIQAKGSLAESPEARLAIRSATAGEYGIALEQFSALLAKEPENPLLLYYVGLCHLFKGDARKAAGFFEQAIALKAKFPEAYYWAAQAHEAIDESERARDCVKLGLERFPKNKKLLSLDYQGSQ